MEVNTDHNKVENTVKTKKKENSKIYFFIIAIATLLLTNVYFYVKYKSSGEKLYTVALQKEKVQREIDRIEAELDNIKNIREFSALDSDELIQKEQNIRAAIAELRANLEDTDLSEVQLENLEKETLALKGNVSAMKVNIEELKLQNEILRQQNEQLSSSISSHTNRVQSLEATNRVLREKVGVASSIKVSNIQINGLQIKRRGNKDIETRAKRVDELQVQFSIADNPLARVGKRDIFVRIVDPNGNLIADPNNTFSVNNDQLQYTFKQSIDFTNNGEEYELIWNNDGKDFKKGAYTVLLYADNAIMGRSSIVLK